MSLVRPPALFCWIVTALLLGCALYGGLRVRATLSDQRREWRALDERGRRSLLQRGYEPLLRAIERNVSEEGGLVLYSGIDPALVPYYAYPRRIWQIRVDPETNQSFMILPPSGWPERSAESFDAGWAVTFDRSNAARGGVFFRLREASDSGAAP